MLLWKLESDQAKVNSVIVGAMCASMEPLEAARVYEVVVGFV